MGYVPPYVPDQRLIYGSRTKSSYASAKLQLHPVERIPFKDVTEKSQEFTQPFKNERAPHRTFQKILTDLTGKGQNVNEVI